MWAPWPVRPDECVSKDDELSHDGCDGELWRFPRGDELLVFGFEIWVEPEGDEGRHVERVADLFASSLHEGLALPLAGLPRHGCQASEACDLLAELGKFGDEPAGR